MSRDAFMRYTFLPAPGRQRKCGRRCVARERTKVCVRMFGFVAHVNARDALRCTPHHCARVPHAMQTHLRDRVHIKRVMRTAGISPRSRAQSARLYSRQQQQHTRSRVDDADNFNQFRCS